METGEKKYSWAKVVSWALLIFGVFFTVIVVVLIVAMQMKGKMTGSVLAVGGIALAAGAALVAIAAIIGLIEELARRLGDLSERIQGIQNVSRSQATLLTQAADNILLSDAAKEVAFREKDRETLRKAIREDIGKRDWEGAELLIDRLEKYFGYRAEAAQLREEMTKARESVRVETIEQSIRRVEEMFERYYWEPAAREIKRLLAAYPNEARIKKLPEELENQRQRRKRHLLAAWDEAVHRNEIDHSIELLRELDLYLTPSEAEGLRESVRDVFKAKLRNLGVQFSIAVSERAWATALRIGQQLVEEFPNSRMSQEVKGRLDVLKKRAEEEQARGPVPA